MTTITAKDGTLWAIVPVEMTDDQADAVAKMANCCGGIAESIHHAMLRAAPPFPGVDVANLKAETINKLLESRTGLSNKEIFVISDTINYLCLSGLIITKDDIHG